MPRSRTPRDDVIGRRLALLQSELDSLRPLPAADEHLAIDGSVLPRPAFTPDGHTRPRLVAVPDPDDPDVLWTQELVDDPAPIVARAAPSTGAGPSAEAPPEVATLPDVGRHASRRRSALLPGAWVPDSLRGRVGISPPALVAVAVLAALGLGVTAWLTIRDQATVAPFSVQPVAAGLATPVAPAGGSPGVGTLGHVASSPTATGSVIVDVAGKVRHPGIVTLPAGSRVIDALRAAGGARPGVDLTALNQARVLIDGEQLLVGRSPASGFGAAAVPGTSGSPGTALVSLNAADETTLETLPGVGPVTANAIISWRSAHGGFSTINELLEVDGIGDATLAKLAPLVTL